MNREDLVSIFDENGLLSNCIEHFEFRENQLSMAQMLCGIPKVNNTAWGVYPYANQGCCTSLATI